MPYTQPSEKLQEPTRAWQRAEDLDNKSMENDKKGKRKKAIRQRNRAGNIRNRN
jgi:hypothetical protein